MTAKKKTKRKPGAAAKGVSPISGVAPPEHTRFGQPGANPSGTGMKQGDHSITAALRRIADMDAESFAAALDDPRKRKCKHGADVTAWRLVELTFRGDGKTEASLPAMREFIQRIDGKVPDRIAGADGDGPAVLNVVFREVGEE